MSSALDTAIIGDDGGAPALTPSNTKLGPWESRREDGRSSRKKFEDTWRIVQSYLDGKQWVGLNKDTRSLVDLRNRSEEQNREHYVIDLMSQYVRAQVGRIMATDFRPPFAFRRDDWEGQKIAAQAQRAFDYAWEEEIGADEVLYEIALGIVGYGTQGLWVRYDPMLGAMLGEVPMMDGRALLDPAEAHEHVAKMAMLGQQATFKPVREGKIVWQDVGWQNIIPPPGVRREQDFPWLILERPVPVSTVRGLYGSAAEGLTAEKLNATDTTSQDERKLKDHLMLCTGYEFPTPEHPRGQEVVFAQGKMLERRDQLPYCVKGQYKAGVFFFHWQRLKHRFWSQGVAEKLIGPQRNLNRRRSQVTESIDRMGLGRVYAPPGAITAKNVPMGRIGELVEIKPQYADAVREVPGTGPGQWIQADAEISKQDMDRAAGQSDQSFGQAPQGVTAYSSMALLREEQDRNLGPTIAHMRQRVAEASEVTFECMRMFWPPNKQLEIAGEEHVVDAVTFNARELPLCYYVEKPRGAPAPNSPAAEIQKCFDIYDRSIQGGHPLPLTWLYDSLAAGKALPLPKQEIDVQQGKAEMENHLLIRLVPTQPAQYDNDQLHIQTHRAAQAAYQLLPNSEQIVANIEAHINAHVAQAQMKQGAAMLPGQGVPGLQGPQGALAQAPPENPLAPPGGVQLPTSPLPSVGA